MARRMLGVAASSGKDIPTYDQLPDVSGLVVPTTRMLASDASLGTSSATISGLTIASLTAGTYLFEGDVVFGSGGSFNLWFRLDFTGSLSTSQFRVHRMAGNAIVNTFAQTLGTEQATGTTTPQLNKFTGMFTASGSGNFIVQARRASSSTSTMEKGSWVRLTKTA